MKKKIIYLSLLVCCFMFFKTASVNAEIIKADDVGARTYIIGKHMFTRETNGDYKGRLTTQYIMLGASSIESNKLEDMIIYYKDPNGIWKNALTNKEISTPESFGIEYKNLERTIPTPELSYKRASYNSETNSFVYDVAIDYETFRTDKDDKETNYITGWELYVTSEDNPGDEIEINGVGYFFHSSNGKEVIGKANVEVGKTYKYRARTYIQQTEGNIYSDWSEEITIKAEPEAPTLTNVTVTSPTTEEFLPILEDGKYTYDLGINSIDYSYEDENANQSSQGYKVYEKNGEEYTLVSQSTIGGAVVVEVEPGEKKTYVATVYVKNTQGEEKESDYSNEIVIDHTEYETPEFSVDECASGIDCENYLHALNNGKYTYDLKINSENYSRTIGTEYYSNVSGFIVYEKVGEEYNEVKRGSIGGAVVVEVEPGEKKTYVAAVYAKNTKDEEEVSDYSNEITIDYTEYEIPELTNVTLATSETDEFIPTLTDGKYTYDLGVNTKDYTYQESSNVSGFIIYEKVGEKYNEVKRGAINGTTYIEVEPGESKVYVAAVYAKNTKDEEKVSGYSNEIVIDHTIYSTPTLSLASGQKENAIMTANLSIRQEGAYATNISNISGYELYEIVDGKYINVDDKEVTAETFSSTIEVDIGEKRTFVAKVYAKNVNGDKTPSEYSNEIIVDNSKPETPTLSQPAGSKENGILTATLMIRESGAYAEDISNISGYELYEIIEGEYVYVETKLTTDDPFQSTVTVGVDEERTFVAKAYALNKNGEEVPSDYSNEVIVDNPTVETPTLSLISGSKENAIMTVNLGIRESGAYAEDISNITGYKVYEKTEEGYDDVAISTDGGLSTIELDIGEKKTFVAKAYTLNKNGTEVYSDYSNEIVVDNSKPETPTLAEVSGSTENGIMTATLDIRESGAYAEDISNITGYKLYEIVDGEYNLVDTKLTTDETFSSTITVDANESRTFVAVAYALNKNGEEVPSDYSNEVIVDNTSEENPESE